MTCRAKTFSRRVEEWNRTAGWVGAERYEGDLPGSPTDHGQRCSWDTWSGVLWSPVSRRPSPLAVVRSGMQSGFFRSIREQVKGVRAIDAFRCHDRAMADLLRCLPGSPGMCFNGELLLRSKQASSTIPLAEPAVFGHRPASAVMTSGMPNKSRRFPVGCLCISAVRRDPWEACGPVREGWTACVPRDHAPEPAGAAPPVPEQDRQSVPGAPRYAYRVVRAACRGGYRKRRAASS